VARKPNSLAGNHKTGSVRSGNASAPSSTALAVEPTSSDRIGNDVLVWLTLAGVFATYCVTMRAFFPLGD